MKRLGWKKDDRASVEAVGGKILKALPLGSAERVERFDHLKIYKQNMSDSMPKEIPWELRRYEALVQTNLLTMLGTFSLNYIKRW